MKKKCSAVETSISKRLLISLLTIGMALNISGCSSSGSSDEESAGGDETFAEESSGDFEDGEEGAEVAEGEEGGDLEEGGELAEGEEGAEEGTDVAEGDGELDGELDGETADSGEASGDGVTNEGGGDVAAVEDDDELSLDDEEGLPEDVASSTGGDAMAPIEEPATPPTDAPVFAENTEAPVEPAPPKVWAPLLKVKSAAFEAGGTNLNRVYLGRPGDTVKGVAEKIYGDSGRSKDLRKWNGFLSRGVKTGDKIYYSSPTNPTDTNMLTYYEDVSIPAQNYVSREGDNIREVSKTLLVGNSDSWKEVWATNPDIESKGDIPAGLNIRYWPADAVAAPVLANNPPPTDPPMGQDPLAQQPVGQDPLAQQPIGQDPLAQQPVVQDPSAQPPADPLAPNDPVAQIPSNDPLVQPTGTPASDPNAMATTEPPPPPPNDRPNQAATGAADPVAGTSEADQMMTMGLAGIVLLAAGAVFFLMRRNRSRKIDLTQTTQVG
jgi:hypothetical protein